MKRYWLFSKYGSDPLGYYESLEEALKASLEAICGWFSKDVELYDSETKNFILSMKAMLPENPFFRNVLECVLPNNEVVYLYCRKFGKEQKLATKRNDDVENEDFDVIDYDKFAKSVEIRQLMGTSSYKKCYPLEISQEENIQRFFSDN